MIITNLSARERQRFITQMEHAATTFRNIAAALTEDDDAKAALHFAVVTATLPMAMLDLADAFASSVAVEIPDHPGGAA